VLPKISVIIPVYNTEKYLSKAIDSILESSIVEDIEIIVVDDASPGNCKEIVEKYKNIIYLKHSENKGVFQARYTGYEYAKGEFLIQLDPDDSLFNDIYAHAYTFAKENNSDIVMFNMQNIDIKNQTWLNKNEQIYPFINKNGLNILDIILYNNTNKWTLHTCWNKLVKKDIVKKVLSNLKDIKNVNLADDLLWSICFFLELKNKNSISATSLTGLNYFIHQESITKRISKKSFIRNITSINNVFNKLKSLFNHYKLSEDYNKLLMRSKIHSLNSQYKRVPKKFSFYKTLDFFKLNLYRKFYSKYYEDFYIDLCTKNILDKIIQKDITEVSIYGTNELAINIKEQLEKNNIKVKYFISSQKLDLPKIEEVPLFVIDEIKYLNLDTIIIASAGSFDEICNNLIEKDIFPKNIISVYL
jgi:glycosyltransferase involved in cell wall biosynthesis